MTLQEAIRDKDRPLSVPPMQWMQYVQANDYQDDQIVQSQVKRIKASQENKQYDQVSVEAQEKMDIGIQQMILGCKITMKSLQELQRLNVSPKQRKSYEQIKDLINNAIAPYLADILEARKGLYK